MPGFIPSLHISTNLPSDIMTPGSMAIFSRMTRRVWSIVLAKDFSNSGPL